MVRAGGRGTAIAATAVVIAAASLACGAPGDAGDADTATAPTTAAAPPQRATPSVDGQPVGGDGYQFTAPAGWQPAASAMVGNRVEVDVAVAGPTAMEGVQPTITVMVETGSWADLAEYTAAHRGRLVGQTSTRPVPRAVAGIPAVTFDVTYAQDSTTVFARRVLCLHSGRAYAITLYTTDPPLAEDLDTFDVSLASWTWA